MFSSLAVAVSISRLRKLNVYQFTEWNDLRLLRHDEQVAGDDRNGHERNSENPLDSRVLGVLFLESTLYREGIHFIDFLERMDKRRLLYGDTFPQACTRIREVSSRRRNCIFRKAFVIRWNTLLVAFNHVINISFIRNQACEVLAQIAPSGCIPVNNQSSERI